MTQTDSRLKSLFSDTALFGISSFGSKILLFLLTPLYTGVLTTAEYGVADLIRTTVSLIYPLLTLSIAEGVLRFAMEEKYEPARVLCSSLPFVFVSSLLLFVVAPGCDKLLPEMSPYWSFFIGYYFLFNLHNCFANYVKAIGKSRIYAVGGIIQTVITIISSIVFLVFCKMGLVGYLYSLLLGSLAPVTYMFFAGKLYKTLRYRWIDAILIRKMLVYSIPMIPTILSWSISMNLDKYMIIGMIGLGASGIYSVAHKIPGIVSSVFDVFLQAWQINAISIREDSDESAYTNRIYGTVSSLCLLCCLAIIPFSKVCSKLLFAESYYSAWQSIPMLMIATLFSALSGLLAAPFRAHKDTKGLFVSVGIGAVINLVLNLILIPGFGLVGAGTATAISFFSVWFVRSRNVQRYVEIHISRNNLIAYCILFIVSLAYVSNTAYAVLVYLLGSVVCLILLRYEIRGILTSVHAIAPKFLSRSQRNR